MTIGSHNKDIEEIPEPNCRIFFIIGIGNIDEHLGRIVIVGKLIILKAIDSIEGVGRFCM